MEPNQVIWISTAASIAFGIFLTSWIIVSSYRMRRLTDSIREMKAIVCTDLQNQKLEVIRSMERSMGMIHHETSMLPGMEHGVREIHELLTDSRSRGTIGEIACEAILTSWLPANIFERQFLIIPGKNVKVDFAVKIPNTRSGDKNQDHLWIPIDAKFHSAKYKELCQSYQTKIKDRIDEAKAAFLQDVRKTAESIQDKYIDPRYTAEVALMYVPSEGIYLEIVADADFFQQLVKETNVMVTGPSTLNAMLSALKLGLHNYMRSETSTRILSKLRDARTEAKKVETILREASEMSVEITDHLAKELGPRAA